MTTTTEADMATLTLFIHLPGPGRTLDHHERKVQVLEALAPKIVRAFYESNFTTIWLALDVSDREWIHGLTEPHDTAWSSSSHADDLKRFVPDLL